MDLLSNLALGFGVVMTVQNIAYCFVGCVLGTLVGVLPGIGPIATISILLPVTYGLSPVTSLIMLSGIFYGAQYGGSTTAILVNLPGESSSIVTCIDGHQLARQGRAGTALGVAALASFFAGTVATLIIALFAPRLAVLAVSFGPPDYFSLMLLGLIGAAVLASGSLLTAFAMIVLGIILGLVGTDVNSGVLRMTLGLIDLSDGFDFVVLAMGLYGFSEILANLEQPPQRREVFDASIRNLLPDRQALRESAPAALRGTAVGSILGILPGGGALLASFAAYAIEKKVAGDPSRFGKGAIEGVAAPEAANNAGAQTSFIPMLTLGIPSNAVMALMIGALTIQGIAPGPTVMTKNPDLFWGLIVSMWIGNLMLVVLNLPMIGIWVKLLAVPYRLLFPAILFFCSVGIYSLHSNPREIAFAIGFGVIGYLFYKLSCEPAPLLLGFILGPLMEENFIRAMRLSRGDPSVFFTQPISLVLLCAAAILLLIVVLPAVRKTRDKAFQE